MWKAHHASGNRNHQFWVFGHGERKTTRSIFLTQWMLILSSFDLLDALGLFSSKNLEITFVCSTCVWKRQERKLQRKIILDQKFVMQQDKSSDPTWYCFICNAAAALYGLYPRNDGCSIMLFWSRASIATCNKKHRFFNDHHVNIYLCHDVCFVSQCGPLKNFIPSSTDRKHLVCQWTTNKLALCVSAKITCWDVATATWCATSAGVSDCCPSIPIVGGIIPLQLKSCVLSTQRLKCFLPWCGCSFCSFSKIANGREKMLHSLLEISHLWIRWHLGLFLETPVLAWWRTYLQTYKHMPQTNSISCVCLDVLYFAKKGFQAKTIHCCEDQS